MKDSIRVLIVDDEPHARAGIRQLLAGDPDCVIVGDAGDGPTAVRLIEREQPDLVLLDVQMPEMDGFEVLEETLGHCTPVIIFVTAYDRFAVDAFSVNALDYLIKPFSDARFHAAIARAKAAIRTTEYGELGKRLLHLVAEVGHSRESRPRPDAPIKATPAEQFIVKTSDRIVLLDVKEVEWIEAASYYARLHTARGPHLIRETLNSLEARLDPQQFVRVHRSAIVAMDRVREIRRDLEGAWAVALRSGREIPLSRARARPLAARLEQRARKNRPAS